MSHGTLLIVGASGRAAAQSARRAGWRPFVADLFLDRDTQQIAEGRRVADYPGGLLAAARDAPAGPCIYTGGLENYPQLLNTIAGEREMWGIVGDSLAGVRDPLVWTDVLSSAGLPALEVTRQLPGGAVSADWVCKPSSSCGGTSILRANDAPTEPSSGVFYQRFADGVPLAAIVLSGRTGAMVVGVSRQLIGTDWAGGSGFQYVGSIGPFPLPAAAMRQIEGIAARLTREFGLVSLWGLDGCFDGTTFWPIEINPRYTASVEIVEWALDAPLLAWHAAAFLEEGLPEPTPDNSPGRACRGKAIVFAQREFLADTCWLENVDALNDQRSWPLVADVPHEGEQIDVGHPICTVFAEGDDGEQVEFRLKQRINEIIRRRST